MVIYDVLQRRLWLFIRESRGTKTISYLYLIQSRQSSLRNVAFNSSLPFLVVSSCYPFRKLPSHENHFLIFTYKQSAPEAEWEYKHRSVDLHTLFASIWQLQRPSAARCTCLLSHWLMSQHDPSLTLDLQHSKLKQWYSSTERIRNSVTD